MAVMLSRGGQAGEGGTWFWLGPDNLNLKGAPRAKDRETACNAADFRTISAVWPQGLDGRGLADP